MTAATECRNDDERRARDVLRSLTGWTVECVDPGGGSTAVPDLMATRDDGTWVAVEVTSQVNPGNRSLGSELKKRDWSHERLGWRWNASYDPRADLRELHDEFADLFAALEEAGVEAFDRYRMPTHQLVDGDFVEVPPWHVNHRNLEDLPPDLRPKVEPILERLFELGIPSGTRMAQESPGSINLQPMGETVAYDRSSAADALTDAISRPDNLAKLLNAEASERHLFLWVHFDEVAASAALQTAADNGIVLGPTELPDGIDAAWVAGAWRDPEKPNQLTSVVFYVGRDGRWEHLGPVEGPPSTGGDQDRDEALHTAKERQ